MNPMNGSAQNMSATSTVPGSSTPPSASSPNGLPPAHPSNSQIEAVIQMATSAASSVDSRTSGRDTRTQLFVGNLPYRVRWQDLKDLFRKAGTVLRADVSLGPDNRSKGYGTVLLATAEDAARAVEMYNGYNWQTRTLEVRPDRLPPDFDNPNLMATSNPSSLPSSAAGTAFPVPIHPIVFGTSLVDNAVVSLDDLENPYGGSRPRASSSAGYRNLFVANLPFHCQWQDLKDLFRQAGTIVRADVALGPDGRSRGFGTVCFATEADAERAVNIFNGYEFNGRTLKVHHDKYSQGQPSQSPTPAASLPAASLPNLHHAHPNAPTHIPIPIPLPPTAFEQFVSGHQSPQSEHLFGQISPYDLYPPHIATMAANAAAQAYMNNPPRSPPAVPPSTASSGTASLASASATLPPIESKRCSTPPRSTRSADDCKSSNATPSAPTHNPPHPGPIVLPSPPLRVFPHMSGPVSPLQGLPPITPSMPSFTFVPQMATPPLNAHFLSPGVGLSPHSPSSSMSPGVYYHPSPTHQHPLGHVWNAAPGAPLHLHSPVGSPGSPGCYVMPSNAPGTTAGPTQAGLGMGICDYFSVPLPPQPSEGYFPPVATLSPSQFLNDTQKEARSSEAAGSATERNSSDNSISTTSDDSPLSNLGSAEARTLSSNGTLLEEEGLANNERSEMKDTIQSFNSLSVDSRDEVLLLEASVSEAPAPHRTNSDGAPRGDTLRSPGERIGGTTLEYLNGSETPTHPERRASWTPQATRAEFRRGLPT